MRLCSIASGSSGNCVCVETDNTCILVDAGVNPGNIDVSDACTVCDTVTFYSHRGMNGVRGTMGAGICIGEPAVSNNYHTKIT